jgi:hypothetical protein
LAVAQKEVARYVSHLLQLKAHLICKFYKPQTIVDRAGLPMQADMQLAPAAVQLIKDKQFSHFRLLVSVDAIQDPNDDQEKQDRTQAINAITGLLGQMIPAIKENPSLAPLGITLLKWGIAGFKSASTLEGQLDTMLQQVAAQAMQGAQQPPQPTPKQLKLQAQQQQTQAMLQKTQMQEQTKQQQTMVDAQLRQQEIGIR